MSSIECVDVTFSYRRRVALDGFTATFERGLVGLLGPNGAGKSTLMSIFATLLRPDRGAVSIGGVSITETAEIRRLVGFMPQRFGVMRSASVMRNVEYSAWARGIARSECRAAATRAIERCGLVQYADRPARSLSGGYRQRLGLACTIVHQPRVLLLDEPTVAIDPMQRIEVRALLGELAEQSTVVVSTHLVEDVALAGTQVVMISDGRAVYSGSVAEIEERGRALNMAGVSDLEAGYHATLMVGGAR